jgi:hypothetical protein
MLFLFAVFLVYNEKKFIAMVKAGTMGEVGFWALTSSGSQFNRLLRLPADSVNGVWRPLRHASDGHLCVLCRVDL